MASAEKARVHALFFAYLPHRFLPFCGRPLLRSFSLYSTEARWRWRRGGAGGAHRRISTDTLGLRLCALCLWFGRASRYPNLCLVWKGLVKLTVHKPFVRSQPTISAGGTPRSQTSTSCASPHFCLEAIQALSRSKHRADRRSEPIKAVSRSCKGPELTTALSRSKY